MTRMRKMMSVLAISAASVTAGWFGYEGVINARFAHAEQQVVSTRQELKNANDMASVFRSVGKSIEPSVVQIEVHKTVHGTHALPTDPDFLKRFFPRDENGQPRIPEETPDEGDNVEVGTGSGVIMDADSTTAYILTNNHVAGGATDMTVTLSDGRAITKAKLVGADPKSDLAVVKIEAEHVIPAVWGNSDDLQKGDWILAFGSPFGYIGSMTHGIVSALNRTNVGILGNQGYENFIQVDAPINPGNSGGPLVNLHGEVVGINTAIASRSGSFSGIGFAIPSNQAKTIYATLKEKGKITRGWLGVAIEDVGKSLDETKGMGFTGVSGVLVRQVLPKAPAADKLQPGDIVTEMNDKPVNDVQQLRTAIAQTPPNTDVTFKVFRDGQTTNVTVHVAEQPEDEMASANPLEPGDRQRPHSEITTEKLGMTLQDVTDELAQKYDLGDVKSDALVTAVAPAPLRSGLAFQPGDLITKINQQKVENAKQASDALANADLNKGVRVFFTNHEGTGFAFLKNGKSE